jgi:hypothetical protein
MAVFWDAALCVITLMMEAVSSSEIVVNIYQTAWCNIPEDGHLHTHCRENLKYHLIFSLIAAKTRSSIVFGKSHRVLAQRSGILRFFCGSPQSLM